MSEIGALVKMLGSPLWLIFTIAAAVGGIFYPFAAADLKNAAGRERLRTALHAGGHWRRLYIQLLTPALDRLDRFLGDADKASFSLRSPFGNREAHPYWTCWSFDRCALLALVYPLLSLFVVWVWTGESGPIAEWLKMKHGAPWWSRLVAAISVALLIFAFRRAFRASGWRGLGWFAFAIFVTGAGVVTGAGAGAVAVIVAVAVGYAVGYAGAYAGVFAFAFAVVFAGAGAVAGAVIDGVAVIGGVAFVVAVAVAGGVTRAAEYWERRHRLGWFWSAYWSLVFGFCYICLIGAVWIGAGPTALSLALMFALVPIVNVPLDWASLGLTRALLRRGIEEDAPSPVLLGLLDFVFGLILLVLLAVALIAALQVADAIIVRFGGEKVANVVALLGNIADHPRDPANYWAYFILFSTLIPSALNAVIGSVSLIGWWLPRAREWVLTQLRALDSEDDEGIRIRVSTLLALQVGIGTALTCLVLWGLWELLLRFTSVLPFAVAVLKQFALLLA
jgi:hypothetical protein